MGTRGLTIVLFENEIKVAQYGQWDHYPSGQGQVVTNFISDNLIEDIKDMVQLLSFGDKEYFENIDETLIGEHDEFWYLNRDVGSEILQKLMDHYYNDDDIGSYRLCNEIEFAGDSLFCEYAYLINLDNNTLEVYKGFNETPLGTEDRFYEYKDASSANGRKYYPITLVLTRTFGEIKEHRGEWLRSHFQAVNGKPEEEYSEYSDEESVV